MRAPNAYQVATLISAALLQRWPCSQSLEGIDPRAPDGSMLVALHFEDADIEIEIVSHPLTQEDDDE